MISWVCKNCRKDRQHRIKPTKQEKYKNYKILICQHCEEKEMVPESVLKMWNKTDENVNTMKVIWEALENTE